MFLSDRILFLELQKTGCTHIRSLLEELVGGELVGKHNRADAALLTPARFVLGSIRNPWDWYVSLWAYGCDQKGAVFGNVTKQGLRIRGRGWRSAPYSAFIDLLKGSSNRNAEKWRRTYRDASDAGAFREWLHMVHDSVYSPDLGEGYGGSRLGSVAGLLTYRYLQLFCCRKGESPGLDSAPTIDQLIEYDRGRCLVEYFIRNESLESDLLVGLELAGIEIPPEMKSNLSRRPKTNTSSRKKGAGHYHDATSIKLVAERDKLVVGKFSYQPPA